MIHSFVSYRQDNWDALLPALEFAYNSAINASTGVSLFRLSTGRQPLLPDALLRPPSSVVPSVSDFLSSVASSLAAARDSLRSAQDSQARYADRSRRDDSFEVGEDVLLSATHVTAASQANRPARKLQPQFLGPYPIVAKVSAVAYKLGLPP